jgi:hypothetical protein
MVFGIVIDVSDMVPVKARLPMLITELGIVTEDRLESANASSPIDVTPSGIAAKPSQLVLLVILPFATEK